MCSNSMMLSNTQVKRSETHPPKTGNMIKLIGTTSPMNEELLNKIIAELVIRMLCPMNEFADQLIEGFMYPCGAGSLMHKHLVDRKSGVMGTHSFRVQDIGNAQLLDTIHMKKSLAALECIVRETDQKDFLTAVQNSCKKLETILYQLLRRLSLYIEVPSSSEIYKTILTKHLSNFHQFFNTYKQFCMISEELLQTALKTGTQDASQGFSVDHVLSETIADFVSANDRWATDLLIRSASLKEYSQVHTVATNAPALTIARSSAFKTFNTDRKNRLRILHRSV